MIAWQSERMPLPRAMIFENGLHLSETPEGVLVRQQGRAYLARRWRLCPATVELVQSAFAAGFPCLIREGHPLANALHPEGKGTVYLAFSRSPAHQWSLAVDSVTASGQNYGAGVFNGKYHAQFSTRGIGFRFEGRNRGAGHLVVARETVLPVLSQLAGFDHTPLALARTERCDTGFANEYDIQNALLTHWRQTPLGRRFPVTRAEYPVDGGMGSRRIDILAKDPASGHWLVVEIKRAEAAPAAVRQVSGYLAALSRRSDFAPASLCGALVAERIPAPVRAMAQAEGILAFEASHPFTLHQVA